MSERARWEAVLAAIDLKYGKYEDMPPVGEAIQALGNKLFGEGWHRDVP